MASWYSNWYIAQVVQQMRDNRAERLRGVAIGEASELIRKWEKKAEAVLAEMAVYEAMQAAVLQETSNPVTRRLIKTRTDRELARFKRRIQQLDQKKEVQEACIQQITEQCETKEHVASLKNLRSVHELNRFTSDEQIDTLEQLVDDNADKMETQEQIKRLLEEGKEQGGVHYEDESDVVGAMAQMPAYKSPVRVENAVNPPVSVDHRKLDCNWEPVVVS